MITFREFYRLDEAYYPGNIGAMELVKFHQKASKEEKDKLKSHIQNKQHSSALDLIHKVTGMKLHPSIVNEGFDEIV